MLICVLLISSFALPSSALEAGNQGNAALETMAVSYVTKFVNNTLLYRSDDLRADTLVERLNVRDEASVNGAENEIASMRIDVDGEKVSAAQLCDNILDLESFASYMKYARTAQKIERYDFTYQPEVLETVVDGDSAYVRIYTSISYKYSPDAETTLEGDNYTVRFAKVSGQWCIVQVSSEEIDAADIHDMAKEYGTRIANFDTWLETSKEDAAIEEQAATMDYSAETDLNDLLAAAIGTYDVKYNCANAVAYAYNYTTQSYTAGTGNNRAFINPNFLYCGDMGGNCQTFVSQCLWAGFGGSNSSSAINGKNFPMDTTGSGDYIWYSTAGDASSTWKCTDPMRRYYKNSNLASQTTGMITNYVSDANNEYTGSLSKYTGTLASLAGAPLYVNKNSEGYGHVVLIVEAKGKTFNKIYYCGNSPMRKYKLLSDSYGSSSTVCLVIPSAMKAGRACTNGTFHVFASVSGKATNFCKYCGFKRLRVTGNLMGPVAQNKTVTVGGSANRSCYRMALCIKTPSGVSKWLEVLNTSSISRSYTFTEKGYYTIQVVARDLNPDTTTQSVTAEQTFTIYVY